MTRGHKLRTYLRPEEAILDGLEPPTLAVDRIRLTGAQQARLRQAVAVAPRFVFFNGSLAPWDRLADWGLVHCRSTSARVTARGKAWHLANERALARARMSSIGPAGRGG